MPETTPKKVGNKKVDNWILITNSFKKGKLLKALESVNYVHVGREARDKQGLLLTMLYDTEDPETNKAVLAIRYKDNDRTSSMVRRTVVEVLSKRLGNA